MTKQVFRHVIFGLFAMGLVSCTSIQPTAGIYPPTDSPVDTQSHVVPATFLPALETPENCLSVERGLAFLKARYNPTLGLLNEAPNIAPHTYWLTNDNTLAAYTLERLGQTKLSMEVWASVRRYGSASNGLIEVLWGAPVQFPPYTTNNVLITQVGDDEIWQELHNGGTHFDDWTEYADLSFLGALAAHQQGRTAEALDVFTRTMNMFNGIGFQDKAFDGQYETYKLALALYIGVVINAPVSNSDELLSTLRAMQTPEGGFATHYRDLLNVTGDANTETTSLALLALVEECK